MRIVALVVLLLAGCAPPAGYAWTAPPGVPHEQVGRDKYACAQEATSRTLAYDHHEALYRICMEARGYEFDTLRNFWR